VLLPRSAPRAGAGDTHVLADLRDGLRYVRSNRRLRLLVGFFVGVVMSGLCYGTVMPGLVENQLGRPAEAVSALFLTSALGGLCATLLAARVADSRHALPVFVGTPFVLALASSPVRSAAFPVAVADARRRHRLRGLQSWTPPSSADHRAGLLRQVFSLGVTFARSRSWASPSASWPTCRRTLDLATRVRRARDHGDGRAAA
jgi:hypothetical protein